MRSITTKPASGTHSVSDKKRAKADLECMRAAGQVGKTCEQGLEIMRAEALRIKHEAVCEAEIAELGMAPGTRQHWIRRARPKPALGVLEQISPNTS